MKYVIIPTDPDSSVQLRSYIDFRTRGAYSPQAPDEAFERGDIRRYGAVPGEDCSAAIRAATEDAGDLPIYIPPGEWRA